MAEKFDLVLLCGPTFGGRKFYIEDHLKESHVEIIPRKVFQSDSNIGLRDVILNVIVQLKKNKKIVVNDENCNRSTWESYVNMVKKKVPSKTVALVSILPKYGLQQLYWSRQFEMLEHDQWESTQDKDITKWFDSTFNISYHTVDEPVDLDGLHIFYEVYPLTLQISIQANIPALFIQWEAIFSVSGTSINHNVVKTCQLWTQKCHSGRIFLFLDLTKRTSSEKDEDIGNNMKMLVKKLEAIPIYLYCVDKEAVKYSIPPNPGLLATIQKSHGVDLQNKNTVLLYHDQVYSKMAEMAGIQFVNASKIFQKPTLVLNKLIFTSPRQPDFLQDMKIRVEEENGMANLPLYELRNNYYDNCISHEVNPGIKGCLFTSSLQSLEKFKQKFEECLKNQKNESQQELQRRDTATISSDDDEVLIQNRSITRELPKWMLGSSKSSSSSLSSHRTDSVNSTASVEVKVKSTVYVMSEQELVEVATDILKQAGREDLLKRIEERKSLPSESLQTPTKESQSSSKAMPCSLRNTEKHNSARKRPGSTAKTDTPNSGKKISCAKGEFIKINNDTKALCTSIKQSKSKKKLDDKYDTSHNSRQTKTRNNLDLDFMDTEDDNVKFVHSKNRKNGDTVVCNDSSMETMDILPKRQRNSLNYKPVQSKSKINSDTLVCEDTSDTGTVEISPKHKQKNLNNKPAQCKSSKNSDTVVSNMETVEISPTRQSKRKNFKYLPDNSVCEQTKQIDSLLDGQELPELDSVGNVTQSKKMKLIDVPKTDKRPALTTGPLDNYHAAESDLSTFEPSLNIDPTELFQNLDNSSPSKRVTLRTPRKQRIEKTSCSSSTHKKPDLSFLDDIFG